ncbi:MAG: hypothetical protein ACPF9D_01120 [Owenweeksia sp.]
MNGIIKAFIIETIWLAGVVLLAIITLVLALDRSIFLYGEYTFTQHDTYFVFRTFDMISMTSAVWIYLVYGIRIWREKFRNPAPVLIHMLSTASLFILLLVVSKFLDNYEYTSETWTVYPPQSGSPQPMVDETNHTINSWIHILTGVQVWLFASILIVGFKSLKHFRV